ncbi:UNVERIFIED_CONTAM: hypothetical protein K2H54_008402 [Gekko kuhli]
MPADSSRQVFGWCLPVVPLRKQFYHKLGIREKFQEEEIVGRSWSIFDNSRQDPTGFTAALEATDLVGVLHMLYCILFHGTIADASAASPKESYAENTVQVALQSLRFFNSFAILDLTAFQSIVGAEGLSLAFRHIVSSLLWHCSQHTCEALLHEVIVCVGYFTVNHPDNQASRQMGTPWNSPGSVRMPAIAYSRESTVASLVRPPLSACSSEVTGLTDVGARHRATPAGGLGESAKRTPFGLRVGFGMMHP